MTANHDDSAKGVGISLRRPRVAGVEEEERNAGSLGHRPNRRSDWIGRSTTSTDFNIYTS